LSSRFQSELKGNMGLYVITTQLPGRGHLDIAKAALEAGASFIQYRDKYSTNREMLDQAKELRNMTRESGAKLIINDRVDIALGSGADGVHLGEDDITLEDARAILGPDYIIGVSTTCLEEALAAAGGGADYIGVGPVYFTQSKDCGVGPIGVKGLLSIREAVGLPVVAIGGISMDNIDDVLSARPDGIAVISAVSSVEDMAGAAAELVSAIQKAG